MSDPDIGGTLAYWEWSAPAGSDIDDIEAVRAANPAFGTRINEDFLSVERAALDDDEYARERLGIFPDLDDAPQWLAIPEPAWEAAGEDYPLEQGGWLDAPVTLAVEMDKLRSRTWICVAGDRNGAVGGDVAAVVAAVEGADRVVEVLKVMTADDQVRRVVIDRGSPANSLIEPLTAAGVNVTQFSTASTVRAAGAMVDAVTSGGFVHRKRPALTEAVSVAQLRKAGDAQAIDRWSSGDASAFIGVTLARAGHLQVDDPPKGKKPGRYW